MAVNDAQVKLSRDLHDTVAQNLAAIKIYQKKGEAEKSAFYADRALMQTHYIIDALHIPLSDPLEKLISETLLAFENNTGIQTECYVASTLIENLKSNEKTEILFVLQEALSNIVRHSEASTASVKITDIADELNIKIHDNGKGFDEDHILQSTADPQHAERKHYGLANMKARIESIGGTLEIISKGGLSIVIRIKR